MIMIGTLFHCVGVHLGQAFLACEDYGRRSDKSFHVCIYLSGVFNRHKPVPRVGNQKKMQSVLRSHLAWTTRLLWAQVLTVPLPWMWVYLWVSSLLCFLVDSVPHSVYWFVVFTSGATIPTLVTTRWDVIP